MVNPELSKLIGQLDAVEMSRRQVLKYGVLSIIGGTVFTATLGTMVKSIFDQNANQNAIYTDVNNTYPTTQDVIDGEKEYQKIKGEITDLVKQDKVSEARNLVTSQKNMFKLALLTLRGML